MNSPKRGHKDRFVSVFILINAIQVKKYNNVCLFVLAIATSLNGCLGGSAGVQAEVLCLEASAVKGRFRSAAVDLRQRVCQ